MQIREDVSVASKISPLFARRLREERERRRLTQAELAQRMTEILGTQLYDSTISLLEKPESQRAIKLEEAVAAARALEVPLTSLISDSSTDPRLGQLYEDLERHRSRLVAAELQAHDAQQAIARAEREIRQIEERELAEDLRNEQWPG